MMVEKIMINKIVVLFYFGMFVVFSNVAKADLSYNQLMAESNKIEVQSGKLYIFLSISRSLGIKDAVAIDLLQKWYANKNKDPYKTEFVNVDTINSYLKFVKFVQNANLQTQQQICESIFTENCGDFRIFVDSPITQITNDKINAYKSDGLNSENLSELIAKKAKEESDKQLKADIKKMKGYQKISNDEDDNQDDNSDATEDDATEDDDNMANNLSNSDSNKEERNAPSDISTINNNLDDPKYLKQGSISKLINEND